MIETPAASLIADDLAAECDFFSIGTNDLIGYTMCADRGNDRVSYLYQVYQPAVLRSLQRIIGEGNKAGIMVGMCGEAAADPLLIPILMSFGLDEYSVSAPSSTPSPLPPSCARGGSSPSGPRRRPTPWPRRSWLSRPQPRSRPCSRRQPSRGARRLVCFSRPPMRTPHRGPFLTRGRYAAPQLPRTAGVAARYRNGNSGRMHLAYCERLDTCAELAYVTYSKRLLRRTALRYMGLWLAPK